MGVSIHKRDTQVDPFHLGDVGCHDYDLYPDKTEYVVYQCLEVSKRHIVFGRYNNLYIPLSFYFLK